MQEGKSDYKFRAFTLFMHVSQFPTQKAIEGFQIIFLLWLDACSPIFYHIFMETEAQEVINLR